jgi:hypothetical protein
MTTPPFKEIETILIGQLQPLIDLLEPDGNKLKNSIKSYEKRLHILDSEKIILDKPHCLYDWAILAYTEDPHAVSFVKFAEKQVRQLLKDIDPKFHKSIIGTGRSMVFSLDQNPHLNNNPSFMNYLAELAGLNHILKIQENRYELLSIEKNLQNLRSADFEFLDKSNKERFFVEMVSLHGIDDSKIEGDSDLILFLKKRFNTKLENKTNGLDMKEDRVILEDGSEINYSILPVIWNEIEMLVRFEKAFKLLDTKFINILPCLSLLPQKMEDNSIHLSVTSVSNIIERWRQQE